MKTNRCDINLMTHSELVKYRLDPHLRGVQCSPDNVLEQSPLFAEVENANTIQLCSILDLFNESFQVI